MDIKEAQKFLSEHHEGVLVTRKKDGGLQMSPVTPGIDNDGHVIISTRETAYKTRNIRRNPRVSLCVFTEAFVGPWLRLDGTASVQSLPKAMDPLIYWQRQIKGEHPNWAEYQDKMNREKRVMVRIAIERVGPERKG